MPIKPPAPPNHRWIPVSQWLGSLGDPAADVRADSSQCQPPGLSLIWGVCCTLRTFTSAVRSQARSRVESS
jgi:hypothetical protein